MEQYEAAKTASARAAGYLREVNIKVGRLKGALTRRRKTERRKRPKGVNTAQGRDDISSELTDEDDPAFEKVLEQIAQSELTAPSLNRPRRLVLSGCNTFNFGPRSGATR
ncbi:hypothetical protein MPER_00524 [Moniliophthora perniciosa FA553]|nr:hypothetical protein MPER_00524 [Moniliophthora perniciosa FA553]